MKTRWILVLGLLLVGACGNQAAVGLRYRLERDLWKLTQEFRRLSIKPLLVEQETWRSLAVRFETLAASTSTTLQGSGANSQDPAVHDARSLVARALVNAAQLRSVIGDSVEMLADYERVIADFQDVPLIVGEVALAQGRLAEGRRQWDAAVSAYTSILDRVEPRPEEPGVPSAVLELPLRIARLQVQSLAAAQPGDTSAATRAVARALYDPARQRYNGWIAAHPKSRIELEARIKLADIAGDLGQWSEALGELRQVEAQLVAMQDPALDPGHIRFSMAAALARAQVQPESTATMLLSVVKDYPKSPAAPRALLSLALQSAGQGAPNEALDYLDRLRDEYPEAEDLLAEGMLTRARILERESRWPEALDVYKSLPVQHPLSAAALQAPLEIVAHYQRVEDAAQMTAALAQAERDYRDFLSRYPRSRGTITARTNLVRTLMLQKQSEAALTELLGIAESLRESPDGANFMLQAARLAYGDMKDPKRAADILANLGTRYPNMEIGRWAAGEATRLREVKTP